MLDLIPKIYDSERQVRLMGEDDKHTYQPINTVVEGPDGQPELLNDLSQARFDIRVDVGPSYTTQRIEAATAMLDYAKSDPAAMPFMRDVFVENMDWPGARQLAERLKRTIPPQVLGPDEQGVQPPMQPQPDPQIVLQQQRMQLDAQASQQKLQLEQRKTAVHMSFLGVHEDYQRQGLGQYLLMDVFSKVATVSDCAGLYALTLQSLDADSTAFYKSLNFEVYSAPWRLRHRKSVFLALVVFVLGLLGGLP